MIDDDKLKALIEVLRSRVAASRAGHMDRAAYFRALRLRSDRLIERSGAIIARPLSAFPSEKDQQPLPQADLRSFRSTSGRGPRTPWEQELTRKFVRGILASPRRLDTQLCYEAPASVMGNPYTDWLRSALENEGPALADARIIPQGLAFHNAEVITREHYYMGESDDFLIGNMPDFFKPFIPNRVSIEWGPGDGKHALTLAKKCGAPFLAVAIDRSQNNLNLFRAKMRTVMDQDRIVTVRSDFYDPRLPTNPIWNAIHNLGLPTTDVMVGGTDCNVRAAQRVPFFREMFARASRRPSGGGYNYLLKTCDWTQDRETVERAYHHWSYRQFYLSGLMWGCALTGMRLDAGNLGYHVHFDDHGIVTQLVNRLPQDVTTATYGLSQTPVRALFRLEAGEAINCTTAEKPAPAACIMEFLRAGGEKISRGHTLEPTLPYHNPRNPLANTGISVFRPL